MDGDNDLRLPEVKIAATLRLSASDGVLLKPQGCICAFAWREAGDGGGGISIFFRSTFLRIKQNPYLHTQIGVSEFNLDDDLLSHG
ncbi:hypothetical protein T3H00_17480, partial [Pseudomonas fluorescens]|uniref:hypothetical protein n=1 Tax=Pseudomonas fluorescens TaxID=294 RepID=UPI002ACA359A